MSEESTTPGLVELGRLMIVRVTTYGDVDEGRVAAKRLAGRG